MAAPVPPSSDRQLYQLYSDPTYVKYRELYEDAILNKLKFRGAPKCGQALIGAVRQLLQQGSENGTKIPTDTFVYDRARQYIHDVILKFPECNVKQLDRGRNRAEQLAPLVEPWLNGRSVGLYVDVGCAEGNITEALGQLLKANHIAGCDVIPLTTSPTFDFTLLTEKYKLPYADKDADVVSAIMSLHHMENLDAMLSEIDRILAPGGIFIIREHDLQDPKKQLYIDLLHAFYAMMWSDPPEIPSFTTHWSKYRSRIEWADIMKSKGFVSIASSPTTGSWDYYYEVFMRKIDSKEPFPYKREFIDPEALWHNAVTLDLVKPEVGKLPNPLMWSRIPSNFKWEFMGKLVMMSIPGQAYFDVDMLTDYFSEEARMQANIESCPSPFQFYKENYEQIVTKARQLEAEQKSHPNFRYWLREAVYNMTKECTTFKISLTKAIIKYLGVKKILDPSAGWGDRILGAAAAGVDVYHGVDPNPALRGSYDRIIDFLGHHGISTEGRFKITTEDFLKVQVQEGEYDCVLTSPPFFTYEVYSSEPGQSIQGRETVDLWFNDFLIPYLAKAWFGLAVGGYMALYIADVRTAKYVNNMVRFINDELHGKYLGIIAVAGEDLSYAHPFWIWQK